MLASLAASVVSGDGGVPVLVAAVATAPLIAVLVPRCSDTRPGGAGDLAIVAALVLVLAANLAVLGDLARVVGVARGYGLAAGAAVALAVVWPAGARWARWATPAGVIAILLPLALAAGAAHAPWVAWATVASRPALAFDDGSAWVRPGRALAERVTLTFTEPHRVAAAAPATWRVIERDAGPPAVREWRLSAGDALTLRAGDQLALEAGTRVRFEAGRRVPGAPASGIAWADGDRRPASVRLGRFAGIVVTLVGGAVAVAPAAALGLGVTAGILVPLLVLAFVLGAMVWGVYGIALVPDLALTPRALAPLVEVATRVVTPSWRVALIGALVAAVLALFAGAVLAWRARVGELITHGAAVTGRRPVPPPVMTGAIAAGVVATVAGVAWGDGDPWRLFTWGLGVAVAGAIAPRLAAAGPRGELGGAVVGLLVFAAIVGFAPRLPAGAAVLIDHPVLAAAPLAWLAARLTRSRGSVSPA